MKTITLHTAVRNYSRYPIDTVWENAKDLEHVAYLHSRTNRAFELLYVGKDASGQFEYDVMIYRGVRRLFFWGLQGTGFRKIIQKYNIHQLEYIPVLGVKSALNSLLYSTGDSEFPTMMVDEVVMEIPIWMAPLKSYIKKSLARHTAIQCAEDEPFRARRVLLSKKGIDLPFSIYHRPLFEKMTNLFDFNPGSEIGFVNGALEKSKQPALSPSV